MSKECTCYREIHIAHTFHGVQVSMLEYQLRHYGCSENKGVGVTVPVTLSQALRLTNAGKSILELSWRKVTQARS